MTRIQDDNNPLLEDTDGVNVAPKHKGYGARHTLVILSFFGIFNVYTMRVNLSVALVAMVNNTDSNTNVSIDGECPVKIIQNSTSSTVPTGEFPWDESTQGLILSSFFYGYLITQVPGGKMAELFGGKKLFGIGVLITGVLTLLTPLAAKLGVGYLVATRVLMGLGEGVTFPAFHSMIGKWAPRLERTRMVAAVCSGVSIGNLVAFPISGALCNSNFLGGWPSAFYVFGGITCVWFVFWICLVHDTPALHPRISPAERLYIENSVGVRMKMPTPWKQIFSSVPVWAINITFFCTAWGQYAFLTSVPSYMSRIQKFDISQDGLLMALPSLLSTILSLVAGGLADYFRGNGYMSTLNARRLCTCIALLSNGLPLFFMKLSGCDHSLVSVLLTISGGLSGFIVGGVTVNNLDIAHNFAGTIMGIANTFGTAAGILAPIAIGQITNAKETINQWQICFYISAAFDIFGALFFVCFAKGTELSWNKPLSKDHNSDHIDKDVYAQRTLE